MGSPVKMAPAKKAAKKPGKQQLKGKGKAVKKLGKKNQIKLFIDCTHPVEDGIMNCADFEKYLHERIKVGGKTNNFGKELTMERQKTKIALTSDVPFQEVPEVPHQEVPQEEQLERLAPSGCLCQGQLRVEILPDQQ